MQPSESPSSRFRVPWATLLIAMAIVYAFFAGLHTTDFDTPWHLAYGRYILQHHNVPGTDQFSYTARGSAFIYPPFAGVILYLIYLAGGYGALSWLTAIACVAVVILTLRRDESITAALGIIAVPAIAFRVMARADLFNTLLFAALLRVIWSQYQGRRPKLWLIPLLMMLYTNLHLGFVAGLGILVAYAGMEILEFPFADRRAEAAARLRKAWPWLVAGVLVTLVNPFGPKVYRGVLQEPWGNSVWNYLIGEFSRTPMPHGYNVLDWRDPQTAYWWLMAVAAVAVVVAIARKRLGPAVLLAGSMWASLAHIRYQAVFAIVVIMAAGAVLSEALAERLANGRERKRLLSFAAAAAACVLAAFVIVRVSDLVTDRYYVHAAETSVFGTGTNGSDPQRAIDFLRRQQLPGNLFNEFNVGSFLIWRLNGQYPVYVDNRVLPFTATFLLHQREMLQKEPDSTAWQKEADQWGINTLFLSTNRFGGLQFPLAEFCASKNWAPVYLDDAAAIFVRNQPGNAPWIQRRNAHLPGN